jgi:hypothetical protein
MLNNTYTVKKATTSKRIAIFITDSSQTDNRGLTGLVFNSATIVWKYWREDSGNAGASSVTLVTATRGTWTSGGFIEIDATNLPGWYEIGIPDAVLATGASWAIMQLKGATNMQQTEINIRLSALDLDTATVTIDPTVSVGTESYAADNAVPTLAQMLYMIWAATAQFSISGTTLTAYKLDGSTTSMTFTLDSATVPTTRTRTT